MSRGWVFLVIFSSFLSFSYANVEMAWRLCERGYYKEALKIYQMILSKENANKRDKIQAIYGSAICYEKLGMYDEAIKSYEFLEKALPQKSPFFKTKLGQLYFVKNDFLKAYKYFKSALDSNVLENNRKLGIVVFDFLVDVLIRLHRFWEAKSLLDFYTERYSFLNTEKNERRLYLIDESRELVESYKGKRMFCKITHLKQISSQYNDFLPVISARGNRLYFTSNRADGVGGEDIWFAEYDKKRRTWGVPKNMGPPINTSSNEGAVTFKSDASVVIFVKNSENSIDLDLYTAKLDEDGRFVNVHPIEGKINTRYVEKQPSLSPDGNILFFVSDRKGGKGGFDIWYSFWDRKHKRWMEPINAKEINTVFDEEAPFIHFDGSTLYFSSTGYPTFGGYDIYKVSIERKGNRLVFGKVKNLGPCINTSGDDVYFTIDSLGEYAYFSSDRKGSIGGLDIYRLKLPELAKPKPIYALIGRVKDKKTKKPIGYANVVIEDLKSSKILYNLKTSPKDGDFYIILKSDTKYGISFSKKGYLFTSTVFYVKNLRRYKEIKRDFYLTPIEKKAKIRLNNVFFDFGSWHLKPESRLELMRVVEIMKKYPNMVIEVSGHTDNVGSYENNLKLSEKRALSVKEFLVKNGIASDRIKTVGYGPKKPIASNSTKKGRALNRRIEIKILKM